MLNKRDKIHTNVCTEAYIFWFFFTRAIILPAIYSILFPRREWIISSSQTILSKVLAVQNVQSFGDCRTIRTCWVAVAFLTDARFTWNRSVFKTRRECCCKTFFYYFNSHFKLLFLSANCQKNSVILFVPESYSFYSSAVMISTH